MLKSFQKPEFATSKTKVSKRFGGVVMPWTDQQISRIEVQKPVIRTDGRTEQVVMSQWHWAVFSWFVMARGYEQKNILTSVEKIAETYNYTQSLKWWLEVAYRKVRQLEEEGRAIKCNQYI